MLKLFVALAAAVSVLVLTPVAHAQESTLRTFVVQLSAENEVPGCPAGVESGASGVAVVQIDEVTGEITYRVVATNLPAPIEGSPGAHIHVQDPNSPTGLTGPIVVHFDRTGLNTGLVATGTDTTNPTVAAAILANPENYYVNVHTTACPSGTVRGPLG